MKVLILSCNTGQGHNQAGRAIHEKLLERGVECEFVDTLSLVGQKTSDVVSNTYVSMTTHTPQLFHLLYKAGGAISNTRVKSPVYWANKLYREKLLTYLLENRVDAVVTPHLFPAETLTSLRRKGQLTVKTVAVATDYTCIPFWEETDMDYYVVPHRDLVDEFAGKGIPREKLLPFGIPVKNAFRHTTKKAEARRKLGIPLEEPNYLIMSGSMGFGNLDKLLTAAVNRYKGRVHLNVLCGNNQKLKGRLLHQFGKNQNITLVDFTKEVALYMDACDVLFTKPGGLTSTEAAVKNVPLIHTDPIPGCETINAAFFENRGMSRARFTPESQLDAADELTADPQRAEDMLLAQRENCNPTASDAICDLILQG